MPYFAHTGQKPDQWETLAEHLTKVADRAASFAEPLRASEEARVCGLLHDLGKYGDLFQRRLAGQESGLDHWSLGAWVALRRYERLGVAAAVAVQGHHTGLQTADGDALRGLNPQRLAGNHPQHLRLTETNPDVLLRRSDGDGLVLPNLDVSVFDLTSQRRVSDMLDVRMLFSALVDADFVETEAHFDRDESGDRVYRAVGPELQPAWAEQVLQAAIADLARQGTATPEIQAVRADLLRVCIDAAAEPPGLFTLSAPTGSGKTLAMLSFALRHALMHGLRRVVVAIPYLSIIDQTAGVYRNILEPIFGQHYVLEHHSLSGTRGIPRDVEDSEQDDMGGRRTQALLLSENWDAPLVVTTTVQLLESLFANRPSPCRKLHRLATSVILLDEVQTLPRALVVPTLAALTHLVRRFGSTVVMATATQPAFGHLNQAVTSVSVEGWRPREIVPAALCLPERCKRTMVRWEDTEPISWADLAKRLLEHDQALCIVNLKRHAVALIEALREQRALGLQHLSTNMCPAHRDRVLTEVRRRLDRQAPEPCLLISTQCVEAGVDVDFPAVYRALGPLDSIAQAAGRCNRNGHQPEGGTVVIFRPEDEAYPPGGYEQAAQVTRMLLEAEATRSLNLDCPELFNRFYRNLYDLTHVAEQDAGRARDLRAAIERRDFVETARHYRLISQDAINLVVAFDRAAYDDLRAELEQLGRLTRSWVRRARRYAVSLFRPRSQDPILAYLGSVPLGRHEVSDDWFIHLDPDGYDAELVGLKQASDIWIA